MVQKNKNIIILVIITIVVFIITSWVSFSRQNQLTSTNFSFPTSFGSWTSQEVQFDTKLLKSWLGTDSIVFRTYTNISKDYTITLYIAFYPSINAADKAHSPEVCYPGQGWTIKGDASTKIIILGKPVKVKRLIIEKGQEHELVYSWWQTADAIYAQNSTYHLAQIFQSVKSTDSSSIWVRVSASIEKENGINKNNEKSIQAFCNDAAPQLVKYFRVD